MLITFDNYAFVSFFFNFLEFCFCFDCSRIRLFCHYFIYFIYLFIFTYCSPLWAIAGVVEIHRLQVHHNIHTYTHGNSIQNKIPMPMYTEKNRYTSNEWALQGGARIPTQQRKGLLIRHDFQEKAEIDLSVRS